MTIVREIAIIPEPKEILLKKGKFLLDKQHRIVISSDLILIGKLLQKTINRISHLRLNIERIETPERILGITKRKRLTDQYLSSTLDGLGEEGYLMNIGRSELVLRSRQAAGIFYGVQTLIQLLENSLDITSCSIRDWPDMKIRGVHFDLKGVMPTFKYLVEAIKKLSRYKINTILMEYEDKFKYDKHTVINSPIALTKTEIKKLIKVAAQHYIQIIPLVQCLGHVEYVLRHKEYRYVAEDNEIQQFCPLNPKTFQLYKDFVSEVLELHKDSKYFHIGGDETRFLGKCKRCKEKADKEGKEKVYMDYIKQAVRFIKEQGKVTILWDDMLTRGSQPELVKELPEETIIMYWLYGPTTDKIPRLAWQGVRASQRWYHKNYGKVDGSLEDLLPLPDSGYIEEIPEYVMKVYKKYWNTNDFPMMVKAFPYIKFLRDRGYKIIGASAVKDSRDSLFPSLQHIGNIKAWANQIVRHGELGVISTAWARSNTLAQPTAPFELCWYSIIASGEYYWSAQEQVTEEKFDAKFNKIFFGISNSNIIDAMYLLTKAKHESYPKLALRKIEEIEKKVNKNKLNIIYLKLFSRILYHKLWKEAVFHAIEERYYRIENGDITDYELRQLKEWLKGLEDAGSKLSADAKKILLKTMPRLEVDEFISSNWQYDLEKIRIEEYIGLVSHKGKNKIRHFSKNSSKE